jgi:hypothetical protein
MKGIPLPYVKCILFDLSLFKGEKGGEATICCQFSWQRTSSYASVTDMTNAGEPQMPFP